MDASLFLDGSLLLSVSVFSYVVGSNMRAGVLRLLVI